jgi:hypothetical protein
MTDSPFSYFLGADPQLGYQLYKMSGSGTASPSLALAATIGSSYSPPQQAQDPRPPTPARTPATGVVRGKY